MTSDGREHVVELAAAYALGALEPEEVAAVEAHLSSCAACRQAVADMEGVADLLAYAVPVQAPRPSVREAVMAEVAADARRKRQGSLLDRLTGQWRGWWRPVAAVASGLAILLLALTVSMQQALQTERQQTTALAPHATQEAQLVSLLVSPESTVVALQPAHLQQTGKGRLLLDEQQRRVMLVVDELPRLREGLAYQIWLCNKDVQHPIGRFNVRPNGSAMVEMPLPDDAVPYDWVWVTVEPDDGSVQPPGEIVLTATF